ncbi:MAG TPA: sigma-70 family RNA polymerase sigma factor [Nannocystaceae bacterium]|nr:sigma-70 family RNA polymerase sigma factor [Nannocystaceae bacterium]
MANELELLQRWRDGDAEAGEQLLARHFVGVRKFFAARLTADCDELAQRTFLAFIANRDTMRDDAAMRAFLFGIARKQLARYLEEKDRAAQHVPLSQASFLAHSSPEGAFSRAEQQRMVAEAIAAIDPEVRQCVELFYVYGYKVGEISETCELPLGTVKSRLFRGRAALKATLARLRSDSVLRDATVQALDEASRELDA